MTELAKIEAPKRPKQKTERAITDCSSIHPLFWDPMASSQPDVTRAYSSWTPEHSLCLLTQMHEAWVSDIRSTQEGVPRDYVIKIILPELNKRCNSSYGVKQYDSRVRIFKGKYNQFSQLMNNGSGFGWDETTKLFTARPEVWDAYIASHPGSHSLRTERIDGWNMIEDIFSTVVATGDSQAGLSAVGSDLIGAEEDTDDPYNLDADTPVQGEELPSESMGSSDTSTGTRRKRVREDGSSSSRGSQHGGIEFVDLAEKFSKIEQHIAGMLDTYKKATESRDVDPWDALVDLPDYDLRTKVQALRMLKEKGEAVSFVRMSLEAKITWMQLNFPICYAPSYDSI